MDTRVLRACARGWGWPGGGQWRKKETICNILNDKMKLQKKNKVPLHASIMKSSVYSLPDCRRWKNYAFISMTDLSPGTWNIIMLLRHHILVSEQIIHVSGSRPKSYAWSFWPDLRFLQKLFLAVPMREVALPTGYRVHGKSRAQNTCPAWEQTCNYIECISTSRFSFQKPSLPRDLHGGTFQQPCLDLSGLKTFIPLALVLFHS